MTEVEQNNDANYVFQPGYHGGVASDIPLDQLNKCYLFLDLHLTTLERLKLQTQYKLEQLK